jgi:hypothetical protein
MYIICKVQSHVPVIGHVDILKWLAAIMTASHHSFSHGSGSSHTFWNEETPPTLCSSIKAWYAVGVLTPDNDSDPYQTAYQGCQQHVMNLCHTLILKQLPFICLVIY